MSEHQHDSNASELWQYFQKVINWIKQKQCEVLLLSQILVDAGGEYSRHDRSAGCGDANESEEVEESAKEFGDECKIAVDSRSLLKTRTAKTLRFRSDH